MDQVSIIQWNTKSLRPRIPELFHLINIIRPSVIAVSETWLVPGSHFRVSGYACHRDDRADGYAGSALLVRHSLPFSYIPLPSHSLDINLVAIRVFDITFISIYIPHPNSDVIPDILSVISSVPSPIILLGDFNGHHTSWGSGHCDVFGRLLLDMFDDANLCVINDGSITRRALPSQDPRSVVDLTVCSPSLSSALIWETLPLTYGSDHFPIVVKIPSRATPHYNFNPNLRYRLSAANWEAFTDHLDNNAIDLPSLQANDINNYLLAYSKLVDCIISSANQNIPLKKQASAWAKISPPWWDSDCTSAIKDRKRAELSYNASMTSENFIEYKRTAAKVRRVLSKKKKQGWKNFCENLSPRAPSSYVWRQIKRYRGSFNSPNPTSYDPSSWVDPFTDKLSPPFVPFLNSLPSPPSYLPSLSHIDKNFSLGELNQALNGLKDTSPGYDGIPYSFIINSPTSIKDYFLSLINYFFEYGVVPIAWKTQVIIPIVKPGKNSSDHNSYRPIALSSVLAKIMEHLIKFRLEWIVENSKKISRSQYGFRKGFSTLDSLSHITTDIRSAFIKKESVFAVFLDITAAYDNVLLPVLRKKLLQLSIPERFVRFISNMLMDRKILVKNQGILSPPRSVFKGLPQGSVLSPLLYSLYTSDLDHSLPCTCLQYADDIALYVRTSSLEDARANLSAALGILDEWLFDHGLALSSSKSNCIVFSKKRVIPNIGLSIGQELIEQVNCVKFLGLKLDSRFTGLPHFSYISEKCEKNINILRSLSGVWWGSHPYCQKLLYNAIVRSHLDYGSFLLDPCTKMALDKLDKVQSKCLRIILGAMRSSPINAMQVECVDPPLALRRQYLSDRFLFKLVQLSHHPLLDNLNILFNLLESIILNDFHDKIPCLIRSFIKYSHLPYPVVSFCSNPLFCTPYEALIFEPNIILDFGVIKGTSYAHDRFNEVLASKFYGWVSIFTDASKLNESTPVGAAVWIPSFKIILSYKCPSISSVFTAESIALLEAILFVESHSLNKSIIFSDAKSSLQSIVSSPLRSKSRFPIILKIREALFRCKERGIDVVLAWIPGHSGIPGNETADSCAKQASQIGSENHLQIFSHDLCTAPNVHLATSWSRMWSTSRILKGKHYGDIQPDIPSKPWFFKFRKANKTTTSVICRLRLGHTCSPVFLAKIRVRDHSLCECGLDEGDVDHLLFTCPLLNQSLHDIVPLDVPRPLSSKTILSLVFSPFIVKLSKFITVNNIKL